MLQPTLCYVCCFRETKQKGRNNGKDITCIYKLTLNAIVLLLLLTLCDVKQLLKLFDCSYIF